MSKEYKKIPFYKPPLGEEEANAVSEVVKSGWVTFGSKTEQFENAFANYIGAPYCVMTNSCTHALNMAIAYWKEYKNDKEVTKIATTPFTCAATALAIIWNDFDVEFVDLKPNTDFVMDVTDLPSVPVHYAGKYNNQPNVVVEDSAHRILPNSFTGTTTTYSFYATKNLTTGEGGMVACSTKEEADWYKKARLYGIDKAAYKREGMFQMGDKFWEFESEFLGYKCNPTDINAAIGLVQLDRLDELNAERKRIAETYNEKLGYDYQREAWHLYPILVNERDGFMHYAKRYNIHCSVHFVPLHIQKAFKPWTKFKTFPITDWVYEHIVSLPFYPYMTDEEIDTVVECVSSWRKKHGNLQYIPKSIIS